MSISLEFVGAAQTVTGSRHLLRTSRAEVLLDCGLFQGRRAESRERNEKLGLAAASVNAVVLSHAHVDHSGALPMLCKAGFTGPIYATAATRDLCAVMLQDAAMIQAADARYLNRAIELGRADAAPIAPLYTQRDVEQTLSQMLTVPYRRPQEVAPGVVATFFDAGHVLGSALTQLDIQDRGVRRRLLYTGDLGRARMPILRDPEIPEGADVLVMESTYGDRNHPPLVEMDEQLASAVLRAHARGGMVIIPSFALERAQEVIFSLKKLRAAGRIPAIPVFVDSPMTVDITDVFRLHPDCCDGETRALFQKGDSPFSFEGLHYVSSVEDSMALDAREGPCLIISASGMCEGGRVLHHLKAAIEDGKNMVIIVGFQAQHTLGRRLVEGRPQVRIFGVERRRHAEVVVLNGFSAHAGQAELVAFAEAVRKSGNLQKIVLVHGEPAAQECLKRLLRERAFTDVRIPAAAELLPI